MPNIGGYRRAKNKETAQDRLYRNQVNSSNFASILPRLTAFDGMSTDDILDYNAKYKALSEWYLGNGASWTKLLADNGMTGAWGSMDATQRLEAMSSMLGLAKDANGKYQVGGAGTAANGTTLFTTPYHMTASSPASVAVQGAGLAAIGTSVVPPPGPGGRPPPGPPPGSPPGPPPGGGTGWTPSQPAPRREPVRQQVPIAWRPQPPKEVGPRLFSASAAAKGGKSRYGRRMVRADQWGGLLKGETYSDALRRQAREREARREEAEHQKWLEENSGFTAFVGGDGSFQKSNSGGGRLSVGARRDPLEELDQSAKLKALQDWYKDNSKDFGGVLEKYGMDEESWAKLDPWSRVQMGSKMLDLQGNDDGTYSVGYKAPFQSPNPNYNPDVWDAIKKRAAAEPPTERHIFDGETGVAAGSDAGTGPGSGMEPGKMYLGGSARFDETTGRYRW